MIKLTLGRRGKDIAAILSLLALTIVFFWKITLTNLILVGLDVFTYFYPYREYAARLWRQGHLPLWNPYLFMGVPFLANIQAAVLYPLNIALAWLPAPRMVSWSIALHVFLTAAFTYTFVRRSLRLPPFSSCLAAIAFALSGFVGAQVEHVNQLNVTAWLPLLLLLMDRVWGTFSPGNDTPGVGANPARHDTPARVGAGLLAGIVVALQILAGHTQTTYIVQFGVGLYAIIAPLVSQVGSGKPFSWGRLIRTVGMRLIWLALVVILGCLLSAAQLLPTLELSGLSYRSGGLPYREAVSFSLRPQLLLQSLLPPVGLDLSQVFGESFSEYVAYVGILGLLVALVGWVWGRRPQRHAFGLLALLGLFLALGLFNPVYYLLYRFVPGFALFRAPVRWLLLYSFGLSILVGYGSEALLSPDSGHRAWSTIDHIRRLWRGKSTLWLVPIMVVSILACALILYLLDLPHLFTLIAWAVCLGISLVMLASAMVRRFPEAVLKVVLASFFLIELFVASRGLAYNNPTAPQAYDFLRTAPAHLLTDAGLHRFIAMSSTVFDPGDLGDIRDIYGWQLPERAIYDYVISAKRKEILAFNLPLIYGLYAVDGYDGGLLPLKRFVELQRLFLSEDKVSSDGRLREQLQEIPESRLLSLLNVKYIITDKVYDVWVDNVFYDLQFTALLSQGSTTEISTEDIPRYSATSLGVVSFLQGCTDMTDGTPVAEITATDEQGQVSSFVLRAGKDTAEGNYASAGRVSHALARVGHHWRDNPQGNDYVSVFEFGDPRVIRNLAVRSLIPVGEFHLRGLSLIDRRTASSQTVLLSTSGHFRLVHSGDVKIYQNLDNLPRAFITGEAHVIPDDAETLVAMSAPTFHPDETVILAEEPARRGKGGKLTGRADVIMYTPERVVIQTESDDDGYLVLTDTYYPGWEAFRDGQPVPIHRANLVCRAVELPAGKHQVEFLYRPRPFRLGVVISLVSGLLVVAGLVWTRFRS